MIGKPKLDREQVNRWLEGQRAAEEYRVRERTRWLCALSTEQSLRIYLSLAESAPIGPGESPSPVLSAMRKAAAKRLQRMGP